MKKFGFYFKKGFVLAKMAMKGKSLFTKLLLGLYLILSFLGKICVFTRPIFLIADSNLAMMIVEGHDVEINKLFEGINSKKRYSSLLLSCMFIDGIAIVTMLLLVVPFILWQNISPDHPLFNSALPPIIFVAIFAIAAAALLIVFNVVYAPAGFVTCKGKDLTSGDVLYLAKEGSAAIKGKIVGLFIANYLLLLLVVGIFVAIPFVLGNLIFNENDEVALFVNFVILADILLFAVVDVFFLSSIRLSIKVSYYSLFFDSVEAKHVIIAKKSTLKDTFIPLFSDDKETKED